MLSRLSEPKDRVRRFAAYDGEWDPETMRLRMFGVRDELGYRWYKTARDFLEGELVEENHGKWFYAHAGGLADVQYLFEYLVTSGHKYRVSAAFSGSSAIIVDVERGRHRWRFLDSYWLIREPLRAIGRKLGLEKGEVDYRAPLRELVPYNERDCEILYEAVRRMQELVLELGSELMPTIASTALRLFRRRYLTRDLETDAALNEELRPAYVGGRTEVWDHRPGLSGRGYDVNSSYPFAMLSPQPGSLLRSGLRFPRSDREEYVADVEVDVPEGVAVPPLPHLAEGSLFFDVGPRRGKFCRPELEWAQERGAKVRRVHQVWTFERSWDLGEYARDIYARRKRAEGYESTVYKYLGNACYGKFGELRDKQQLLVRPTAEELARARAYARYGKGQLAPIQPGVYLLQVDAEVGHGHVPFAAYITSRARVTLGRHLEAAARAPGDPGPYYCDTDSVYCDAELSTSPELGDLKLEREFEWGHFFAPKLYALQLPPGDGRAEEPSGQLSLLPGRWYVKAKGFRQITPREFFRLQLGDRVEVTRMLRIRELFARGHLSPVQRVMPKELRGEVRPKRRILESGRTEPWHTRELSE